MSPNLWGNGHIDFGAHGVGGTLVCAISCEPVVGFLPNFDGCIIGT